MQIRLAEESDLNELLEIYNYSILHTTSVYQYEAHDLEWIKDWFDKKTKAGLPILVSLDKNEITGFITYGPFRNWHAYQFTVEYTVHIHQDHQKKGYGKALFYRLLEIAKTKHVHSIMGGVDADNLAGIKFHKKLGFEEVGHLKEVGYKFNRWLDLKFFQLRL